MNKQLEQCSTLAVTWALFSALWLPSYQFERLGWQHEWCPYEDIETGSNCAFMLEAIAVGWRPFLVD